MNAYPLMVIGVVAPLVAAPAFADENVVHVPFQTEIGQKAPTTWEVPIATLKALIASADDADAKSVFIGSPVVWSKDGHVSEPGVYLLDGGGIVIIRGR